MSRALSSSKEDQNLVAFRMPTSSRKSKVNCLGLLAIEWSPTTKGILKTLHEQNFGDFGVTPLFVCE